MREAQVGKDERSDDGKVRKCLGQVGDVELKWSGGNGLVEMIQWKIFVSGARVIFSFRLAS